jgi:hypothetical protein
MAAEYLCDSKPASDPDCRVTDKAVWRLLINLSDTPGYTEMAGAFHAALETEGQHMANVRVWLTEKVMGERKYEQGIAFLSRRTDFEFTMKGRAKCD